LRRGFHFVRVGLDKSFGDAKDGRMVTFDDFKRLDIRIGTVLAAEKVARTDKLIKLKVDIGTETRQIVAGMGEFFTPESFVGKQLVILTNLEAKKFCGEESQGMIMAADVGGTPILLAPETKVPAGTVVR
jgi:methionine--tRNA ligase beta chain